jgi:hypothetical protein
MKNAQEHAIRDHGYKAEETPELTKMLFVYILCTLRLCSIYSSWELKVMNAHASHTYLSSRFSDIFVYLLI